MKELRDRMQILLSQQDVCVICLGSSKDPVALPVRFRSDGLEVDCLVPRWIDISYRLRERARAVLVIQLSQTKISWLQYEGSASVVAFPEWKGLLAEGAIEPHPDELYEVVHVCPERINLIDTELRWWGVSETLDVQSSQVGRRFSRGTGDTVDKEGPTTRITTQERG